MSFHGSPVFLDNKIFVKFKKMENYLLDLRHSDGDQTLTLFQIIGDIVPYKFQNDIIGPRTDSIFDDEIVNSRVERQVDLQGAFSSGGGYCPEGIPVETAIFAALAAFGVAFGVLYRALTIAQGGRKKRDISAGIKPQSLMDEIANNLADLYWWGM